MNSDCYGSNEQHDNVHWHCDTCNNNKNPSVSTVRHGLSIMSHIAFSKMDLLYLTLHFSITNTFFFPTDISVCFVYEADQGGAAGTEEDLR